MTDACREEQAAPAEYVQLFGVKELRGVAQEDTYVESVVRRNNGVIKIDLYFVLTSNDTKVYKIASLRRWENVTTHPVLMEYKGPEYVLFNQTSNCAVGIENPMDQPVYKRCDKKMYEDPRLKLWRPVDVDREDYAELGQWL